MDVTFLPRPPKETKATLPPVSLNSVEIALNPKAVAAINPLSIVSIAISRLPVPLSTETLLPIGCLRRRLIVGIPPGVGRERKARGVKGFPVIELRDRVPRRTSSTARTMAVGEVAVAVAVLVALIIPDITIIGSVQDPWGFKRNGGKDMIVAMKTLMEMKG